MVWSMGWLILGGLMRCSSGSYKLSDTITPFGMWPLYSCSFADLNLSFMGEMTLLGPFFALIRLSKDSRLALARDRRRTVSILMLPMLFVSSSRLLMLKAEELRAYPVRRYEPNTCWCDFLGAVNSESPEGRLVVRTTGGSAASSGTMKSSARALR